MARPFSKRLVIDASIAGRAGGLAPAVEFGTKACRDFLRHALDICHRLVITERLAVEWREHELSYFKTWRIEMVRRKKVVPANPRKISALRQAIEAHSSSDRDRTEMMKDIHLIEAALHTDSRVVSLDDKARRLFRSCAKSEKLIRRVLWINPERPAEQPIKWLRAGAKLEPERKLNPK